MRLLTLFAFFSSILKPLGFVASIILAFYGLYLFFAPGKDKLHGAMLFCISPLLFQAAVDLPLLVQAFCRI